jgi:Type ISP C-terminal specificity domain/N-6 DNA Methylase
MVNDIISILQSYAGKIRNLRRANPDVAETALAPAFQQLVKDLLPHLPAAPILEVMPEFNKAGVGRPDIALIQTGAPPRAFIELKAPSKSANPENWKQGDKRQFERFKELANWATCNFHDFRLLSRGEQTGQAIVVPEKALAADKDDKAADKLVADHDAKPFLALLERLCAAVILPPAAEDAEELATLLAHSAKLIRGIIRDVLPELPKEADDKQPKHPLNQVRKVFREVLYAHPEAAGYAEKDFDKLFSSAFAQTLAFGLLLVREATGKLVDKNSWEQMPEEHPLMSTALRVLSQKEIVEIVGVGFEVIRDTVNSFSPSILVIGEDGRDPILYFYEHFLATFAPEDRDRYGVFYTPIEVVRYMTAALNRALRDNLGMKGLTDPLVTILDPATGTGTFLLGIAEHVRKEANATGMAELALADLAKRMFAFELLIGPYAVAHYRLHHALKVGDKTELPRLGIYLADTLAEPGTSSSIGALGIVEQGIQDERHLANELKTKQPILAIIGNPPYRRLEEGENHTLVGNWMDGVWDDLKRPVRDAGWGNQLNTFPELSVAFWRWSLWKIFEAENAPKRGVVAFITNRKFLTGKPYAGLRQMMRRRFDRIEIIDLRGDSRLGERAGVEGDQNVFNIQVGVCITLAIADGTKAADAEANIQYRDVWDAQSFRRKEKLGWLTASVVKGDVGSWTDVDRKGLDDFRPKPFLNGEWVGLNECFAFSSSGVQSKRDHIVYAPTLTKLEQQIRSVVDANQNNRDELFNSTGMNSAASAQTFGWQPKTAVLAIYRPFDRRFHYNDKKFNDRPRPDLQSSWGPSNLCLYAMPAGTGSGPAVWCHALLPDYHAFRGSYGGYAFLLWDRRGGPDAHNLNPTLLAGLKDAYGKNITPTQVFDCMLCLLSAKSYSLDFAEDLEDVFPHIPFPAQHKVFLEAAALGEQIRAVETFARPPNAEFLSVNLCCFSTPPKGKIISPTYAYGNFELCENGAGKATGIPAEVWHYSVNGYELLPRWIKGREGLEVDLALATELRDICGRIAEMIDLSTKADKILAKTFKKVLDRAAFGLSPALSE